MEGYCTCGAKLAEDALFCHRCGRPLRELVTPEPEETPEETQPAPEPVVVVIQTTAPKQVSFRDGMAVRVALLAAALIQLVSTLAAAVGGSLMLPVVLLGGGFYAVVLYSRRTGGRPDVRGGARLGWMTGIFTFVIMTVFFTFGVVALATSNQLMQAYKESAAGLGLPQEATKQLEQVAADPAAFAMSIVLGLLLQFILLTVMCAMGGALAARLGLKKG